MITEYSSRKAELNLDISHFNSIYLDFCIYLSEEKRKIKEHISDADGLAYILTEKGDATGVTRLKIIFKSVNQEGRLEEVDLADLVQDILQQSLKLTVHQHQNLLINPEGLYRIAEKYQQRH